jgi:hypothetical protein
MSNAHSKQTFVQPDYDNCDYDYDYNDYDCDYNNEYDYQIVNGTKDTLVLCLEENEQNGGKKVIGTKCYLFYDHGDKEYFICGKRYPNDSSADCEDFNFYCKSTRHLMTFLEYLFGSQESSVNHILYNCKDLFTVDEYYGDGNLVDFDAFESKCYMDNELSGYNDVKYDAVLRSKLANVIKMLKRVRY